MTKEEAAQVAAVLSTADDGCLDCVTRLQSRIAQKFPQFDWNALVKENDESPFKSFSQPGAEVDFD